MPAKIHRIVAKAVVANGAAILLIRRSDTDVRRPLQWDIPGGAVEEGENYAEATAREIKEETGLTVPSESLELIYAKTEKRPEGIIIFLFYLGKAKQRQVELSFEHDQFKWLAPEGAAQLIEYKLHKELFEFISDNQLMS